MDYFDYKGGHLYAEGVALSTIAESVGTPVYVYSRATLERHYRAFDNALADQPHQICYAVKANDNLAVLNILARMGSGFDIVSGGELAKVIAAGGDPAKIVFSGVGKQRWEIDKALDHDILCFNIESEGELQMIAELAVAKGVCANISVRINPDVDAKTHPYISTGLRNNKFGLTPDKALAVYKQAQTMAGINIHGVACHIGSQLTDLSPFVAALDFMLDFIETLANSGIEVQTMDFGGGVGVSYTDEKPPTPQEYWQALAPILAQKNPSLSIILAPGRAIACNAGLLMTRVICLKHGEESGGSTNFCVVDAGMNDLIRPALYQGHHHIEAVEPSTQTAPKVYDVVGPICESSDFLGKGRELSVQANELLAIKGTGAYGAVMSSNYNGRPRPAEIMVDGDDYHIVRPRESITDLFKSERVLPQ